MNNSSGYVGPSPIGTRGLIWSKIRWLSWTGTQSATKPTLRKKLKRFRLECRQGTLKGILWQSG
jgi:hypothetical protein